MVANMAAGLAIGIGSGLMMGISSGRARGRKEGEAAVLERVAQNTRKLAQDKGLRILVDEKEMELEIFIDAVLARGPG